MAVTFVVLLLGVMANAQTAGFALWGAGVNIPVPRWDGVAGWDAEPSRCHFSSSVGDDGVSVGDEKEVEDEEDRLEVSSAPEDVTSWRGLER